MRAPSSVAGGRGFQYFPHPRLPTAGHLLPQFAQSLSGRYGPAAGATRRTISPATPRCSVDDLPDGWPVPRRSRTRFPLDKVYRHRSRVKLRSLGGSSRARREESSPLRSGIASRPANRCRSRDRVCCCWSTVLTEHKQRAIDPRADSSIDRQTPAAQPHGPAVLRPMPAITASDRCEQRYCRA